MVLPRILFLSFIFIFSSVVSASATLSSDRHIQDWKSAYLDNMNAEQLQLLANIVYLLYANSINEQIMSQFTTPIARLHQAVRMKISTYQNPTEDLTTLRTLLERLSYVVGARIIYSQTLNTCLALYEKQPVQKIEGALVSIQLYAQARLRAWADNAADETSQQLKKSSDFIKDSMQHLHAVSGLHRGMSEGQMPIKTSQEDQSLAILSIILKNNPELLTVSENISNMLNETTDHAAQIIREGVAIYRDYYVAIYEKLMSSSYDKKYATTLFSMYDVLPDEYRSPLPHPDHVFEHMLQTVKLYTQTEFIQS